MGSLLQQIVERERPFLRYHLLLPVAVLSAAAIVGGCESNSAVTTVPTQLKCQVALAAPSSSIGPDGGMGTVTITTTPECPWDVSTAANWLSGLSPSSGQGTSTVEFRVAPNPLPSSREGEIVVNDNRVRVSQQAAPCRFELRPDSLTIDTKGGPGGRHINNERLFMDHHDERQLDLVRDAGRRKRCRNRACDHPAQSRR